MGGNDNARSAALAQLHHIEDIAGAAKGALDHTQRAQDELFDRRTKLEASCRSEAERQAAAKDLARFDAQIARTRVTIAAQRQDWIDKARLVEAVGRVVSSPGFDRWRLVALPKTSKSIEYARAEVDRLRHDRMVIEHAPAKRAEYEAQIRQMVQEVSRQSAPFFDPRGRGLDPLGLGAILRQSVAVQSGEELPTSLPAPEGAVGLLFGLLGTEIADSLIALLPQDGDQAIGSDERTRRLLAADAAILQAERVEEATVRAAEADGRNVVRRSDANPLAVLGVEAR